MEQKHKREIRKSDIKKPQRQIKKTTKVEEMTCYHCGREIRNAVDVVFKPISRFAGGKETFVNRMFHMDCLKDFQDKASDLEFTQAEHSDWDKCYQYFRKEFMQTDNPLETHAVRRLLGLRVGKYYPQGNNTRILDRGYPFSTIHKAMMIAKFKAKVYASTIQFTDYQHQVNTYMKFIVSEVADVQMRLDRLEKDNQALEKAVEKKETEGVQYVSYLEERLEDNKKEQTIQQEDVKEEFDMSTLWGVELNDEDF